MLGSGEPVFFERDFVRLRAGIAANMAAFSPTAASAQGLKRAAVAIAVTADETGAPAFFLTKRAPRLNAHSGQWALPGGRIDPGESPTEAALRELDEEVGLKLGQDSVIGWLDDYPTRSGYVITPVVVWGGGDPPLTPSPDEVLAVYRIGLHTLRDGEPRFVSIPESDRPVIQIPLGNDLIHAPTGAVLYQFREVAMAGNSGERVDHFEQPVFAWK